MRDIFGQAVWERPLYQAVAQSDFFGLSIQSKSITNVWLTIRIQIHFSKWNDNPIQSQSNFFGKDLGQQILNVLHMIKHFNSQEWSFYHLTLNLLFEKFDKK